MGNLGHTKIRHAVETTALSCGYINDTFLVCNKHTHSMDLLNLFNKAHNDIDFTIRHEVGKFYFSDNETKRT